MNKHTTSKNNHSSREDSPSPLVATFFRPFSLGLHAETLSGSAPSYSRVAESFELTKRKTLFRQELSLSPAFTIVELLIVVVVIAILAAVSIVSYNGITAKAKETTLKNDLQSAATQLQVAKTINGNYLPDTTNLKRSPGTIFQYSYAGDIFCLTATRPDYPGQAFSISNDDTIQVGACSGHTSAPSGDTTTIGGGIADGVLIQTVTSANCPMDRVMAVDARDNNTYWVQQMPDGKCWMLTSLAYAGGGTNTYGDTKSIAVGSSNSYTAAYYFIPTGANPTTNPTAPSTSITGTGQYGYLYNWCAAMGAQTSTSACSSSSTPLPNASISICPSGWRLPTISGTNEFTVLNTTINGGLTNTDVGLRTAWLSQRGGYYRASSGGFSAQGATSNYYSSSQASSVDAYYFDYNGTMTLGQSNNKYIGFSVRCIAH